MSLNLTYRTTRGEPLSPWQEDLVPSIPLAKITSVSSSSLTTNSMGKLLNLK